MGKGKSVQLVRAGMVERFVYAALTICLAAFCVVLLSPASVDISGYLLIRQDRWLLLAQAILLLAARIRLNGEFSPLDTHWARPSYRITILALMVLAFCYGGHHWILSGYDLSRDEKLAVFDSQIYASGLLAQPLPRLWQIHAPALNTAFMLPVSWPTAFVSAYLPMNAALRAGVGLIGDPALTGPLMTALAMIFLWKCARRLWPDDREAAVVAVFLFLGSGQVLFAGMTAYAMPAHLALNLLWLWLFLLHRRSGDLGALLVGFTATGLHQPLFHPLFAMPLLLLVVRDRDWGRVALYLIGYAIICGFWLWWPHYTLTLVSGPDSLIAPAGGDYWTRLLQTIQQGAKLRWLDMAANLFRFAAWQHLLLLPLATASFAVARRDRMAAALAASVVLPIALMLVILPYQGYGFGYRYLHGVMGAAILLAVYGWQSLVATQGWLRSLLVRTTLAGLVVLLPLQAWFANRLYEPFAHADATIAASGADYFVLGQDDGPSINDLIINQPNLANRPLRLVAEHVDEDLLQHMCHPGARAALPTGAFLRRAGRFFDQGGTEAAEARTAGVADRLKRAGCQVEWLD